MSRAHVSPTKTQMDRARASRATIFALQAYITHHVAAPAQARATSAPEGNISPQRGARGAGVAVPVAMRLRWAQAGASYATVSLNGKAHVALIPAARRKCAAQASMKLCHQHEQATVFVPPTRNASPPNGNRRRRAPSTIASAAQLPPAQRVRWRPSQQG